jgi:hypothetical protein
MNIAVPTFGVHFRQLPKVVFFSNLRLNKTGLLTIANGPVSLRTKIEQKHNFWQLLKVHCESCYCNIHATHPRIHIGIPRMSFSVFYNLFSIFQRRKALKMIDIMVCINLVKIKNVERKNIKNIINTTSVYTLHV